MTKRRMLIAICAIVGAVLGALAGAVATPSGSRYIAAANVALVPAPELTMIEASDFWEVLTRGQVTRTAAVIYDDPRWLPDAADTAKVPRGYLTLTASALPETTILTVTVTAGSATAAETALNTVLTAATPEVSSLAAPYFVKVMWPQESSAYAEPAASRTQMAAAGALGGLLIGAGLGWFLRRRRDNVETSGKHSDAQNPGDHRSDAANDGARLGS